METRCSRNQSISRGLRTDEIWKYLENHHGFKGCFPIDRIPHVNSFPCTMIINTANSLSSGEHWIGLYLERDLCLYFDSFGLPIIEMELQKFLSRYYVRVFYSRIAIQHLTSVSCGLFCIAFVKNVSSISSYHDFVNQFNVSYLKDNDYIVLNFI